MVNNYVIVISVAIVVSAASVVVLAVIVVVVVDAVSAAPVVVVVVAVGDIEYYNSSKNATLEEVEPRFTFCMVEYLFSPCGKLTIEENKFGKIISGLLPPPH